MRAPLQYCPITGVAEGRDVAERTNRVDVCHVHRVAEDGVRRRDTDRTGIVEIRGDSGAAAMPGAYYPAPTVPASKLSA